MSSCVSLGNKAPCPITTIAVMTLGDKRGQRNTAFMFIDIYSKKRIRRRKKERKKERKKGKKEAWGGKEDGGGGWRGQRGEGPWAGRSL